MAFLSRFGCLGATPGRRIDRRRPPANVALRPIFGNLNCRKRNMAASTHQELSLFLRLAESLHFARSAKAAHMSPSALTRFIQRLEEELGQPLFQRSRRGVTLTRAGEIFRDHARA